MAKSKMAPTATATASSSKAPAQLPDSFSKPQAKKAVDALLAHHSKVVSEREETELIPREDHIWLVVNTKRGSTKKKLMPKRIQLPFPPLPPPPVTAVGLITKPPQRTYKDLLADPDHNIKFINRVVDTDKLRGKWKPFEARRNLARENDLWLADERIVPSLPMLLGKTFFDAKKIPIPVNLRHKDLKGELGRAINSTYYHPSTGTSHSIRIATPPHSNASQTLENLLAAVPSVVTLLEDGWENVLSIGIKTSSSVLLPIYTSNLEGRFAQKIPAADAENGEEADAKKSTSAGKAKDATSTSGSKKRKSVDAETLVKKAKAEQTGEEVKKTGAGAKKVKAVTDGSSKAERIGKKVGKKSSSVGSGGAGKQAKTAVIGKA